MSFNKLKCIKLLFAIPFIIYSGSLLSSDIETKYTPLDMSDVDRNFYNRFINSQPIIEKERDNPEGYMNYNLLAFSREGNVLNKRNLYFANNFFSERAYIEDNISILFNINNHISGQIHTLNQEVNPVRKRINIENFFKENKEHYGLDFNPYEELYDIVIYNEINVFNKSQYIYEEKKIIIEFDNKRELNSNISFYCSGDVKFAYIMGDQIEEKNNIKSINNNSRVYISLSDNIKNILTPTQGNKCSITKTFKEHEDAIEFLDILNDPRSRFILEFKINDNQNSDSFYIKGSSFNFGLYSFRNNFMNLYDDFETQAKYTQSDFILDIFNVVKDKGFFDYQDIFDIENHYNTELFYPTRAGYIRFDTDNEMAYLFKQNEYKIRFHMEKINNHYKFSLYKVDYINTYNFPREMYFRKLYDGFDLFVNYSYDFNSNIIRVGDNPNPNVKY